MVAMGVVVEALESLLLRVDADDVMDMLKEVALDDKPHLDLDEFATLMESGCPGGFLTWWNRLLRRKAMREVFCLIDCDGSGAWRGACVLLSSCSFLLELSCRAEFGVSMAAHRRRRRVCEGFWRQKEWLEGGS